MDDLDLLRDLGRDLTERPDGDLTSGDLAAARSRLLAAASTDRPAPATRRRRGHRRLLRTAPLVAAAAAVAVITVAYLGGAPAHRPPRGHGGHPTGGQLTPAAALLGKVALAADDTTVTARPDQFVYLDSTVAFGTTTVSADGTETTVMAKPHRLQEWLSVDGSRPGLKIEQDGAGNPQPMTLDPVTTPTIDDPTYQYLTTLPTDPDRLLAMLREQNVRENPGGIDEDRMDRDLFSEIGDIIGYNLVPPALSAALYRAAAKIPGVTVLPDLSDATGRHGIAVARTDNGIRGAWIFDKKTYTYLGERDQNLAPGSTVGNGVTAVLTRAVVDQPHDLPN